jgi:hypothetical protein
MELSCSDKTFFHEGVIFFGLPYQMEVLWKETILGPFRQIPEPRLEQQVKVINLPKYIKAFEPLNLLARKT